MKKSSIISIIAMLVFGVTSLYAQICPSPTAGCFPCQNGCSSFNTQVRVFLVGGSTPITSKAAIVPSTQYDLEITDNSTNPVICISDAFGFRMASTQFVIDECEYGNACFDIGSTPIRVRIRTTSTYSSSTGLIAAFQVACTLSGGYKKDPDTQSIVFPPNP